MIPRPQALERVKATFRVHPVAALLGPRQCGKTTLAIYYYHQLGGGIAATDRFTLVASDGTSQEWREVDGVKEASPMTYFKNACLLLPPSTEVAVTFGYEKQSPPGQVVVVHTPVRLSRWAPCPGTEIELPEFTLTSTLPPVAQITPNVVAEEIGNFSGRDEPLQEEPLQLSPKTQTRKPLAGAFAELYYVGEQSDDVVEVMSRLARLGATVELHEIYAEEINATQGIRESPCWDPVGKALEGAGGSFKDIKVETSQDSCDLELLRLFLVPARSGEQ